MNRRAIAALLSIVWTALLILLLTVTQNPVTHYFRQQAFWLHSAQGSRLYAGGHYALAVHEADAMISIHPDRMEGYAMRGKALARLCRYQEADNADTAALARVAATGQARHSSPQEIQEATAFLYLERGRARSGAGYYGPAVVDLTQALQLYPKIQQARQERMEASFRSGHTEEAAADAEYLIAHKDMLAAGAAYAVRGRAAARQGHYGRAAADLAAACLREPGVADNWFDRGWYEIRAGKASLAVSTYREALVRDPDRVSGWFRLSLANLAINDAEAAMEAFNQGLPRSTPADRAAARRDFADARQDYPAAADSIDRGKGWLRELPAAL